MDVPDLLRLPTSLFGAIAARLPLSDQASLARACKASRAAMAAHSRLGRLNAAIAISERDLVGDEFCRFRAATGVNLWKRRREDAEEHAEEQAKAVRNAPRVPTRWQADPSARTGIPTETNCASDMIHLCDRPAVHWCSNNGSGARSIHGWAFTGADIPLGYCDEHVAVNICAGCTRVLCQECHDRDSNTCTICRSPICDECIAADAWSVRDLHGEKVAPFCLRCTQACGLYDVDDSDEG